MSEESIQGTPWPLPKFYFTVEYVGSEMSTSFFQEVSGLSAESQTIGNVVLKKGICKNDSNFQKWYDDIKMNVVKRQTVIISLVDEGGEATMKWKLDSAWPVNISRVDFKSDGNEVALGSMELAHEGVTTLSE